MLVQSGKVLSCSKFHQTFREAFLKYAVVLPSSSQHEHLQAAFDTLTYPDPVSLSAVDHDSSCHQDKNCVGLYASDYEHISRFARPRMGVRILVGTNLVSQETKDAIAARAQKSLLTERARQLFDQGKIHFTENFADSLTCQTMTAVERTKWEPQFIEETLSQLPVALREVALCKSNESRWDFFKVVDSLLEDEVADSWFLEAIVC